MKRLGKLMKKNDVEKFFFCVNGKSVIRMAGNYGLAKMMVEKDNPGVAVEDFDKCVKFRFKVDDEEVFYYAMDAKTALEAMKKKFPKAKVNPSKDKSEKEEWKPE